MPKLVMKEEVFAAIEAPLWRGLSGEAFVTVETQVLGRVSFYLHSLFFSLKTAVSSMETLSIEIWEF